MVRALWDVVGESEDRRGRQGRQYALRAVVGNSIAAMLAGANDLIAMDWLRAQAETRGASGVRRRERQSRVPRRLSLFLSSIGRRCFEPDADIRARRRHAPTFGHRWQDAGARRRDAKAVHVLAAFATAPGGVPGLMGVKPDRNEIAAAGVLLKGLPRDGAVVTGDAIFTQIEICRHIRARNATESRPKRQIPFRKSAKTRPRGRV